MKFFIDDSVRNDRSEEFVILLEVVLENKPHYVCQSLENSNNIFCKEDSVIIVDYIKNGIKRNLPIRVKTDSIRFRINNEGEYYYMYEFPFFIDDEPMGKKIIVNRKK